MDSQRQLLWAMTSSRSWKSDMTTKKTSRPTVKKTHTRQSHTVGESIIQGLKEAIAWSKGENDNVRVTLVHVPKVDVRKVRQKMDSARRNSRPSLASRRPR